MRKLRVVDDRDGSLIFEMDEDLVRSIVNDYYCSIGTNYSELYDWLYEEDDA